MKHFIFDKQCAFDTTSDVQFAKKPKIGNILALSSQFISIFLPWFFECGRMNEVSARVNNIVDAMRHSGTLKANLWLEKTKKEMKRVFFEGITNMNAKNGTFFLYQCDSIYISISVIFIRINSAVENQENLSQV